ncbi:hypothetical protein QYM36_019882 [Artemia franciscana]|uniref:Endonuclease/exonuclease/phosphatase domain-containing protein n=1 Tax=Artemia franciscana TaxID=6661 RepID=A0AA88H9T3_ARTSF|nr:hypothetical protein QYM36_019882 [Artemia franciscana]
MYKPPSTSESVLQNEVGHIVDLKEKLDCKKVIVAGDFNVDAAKGNIVSAFQQLGYQQLIRQSTTKNGTIIDHVYTDSDVSKCGVVVTPEDDSFYGEYRCLAENKHVKAEHFITLIKAHVPQPPTQATFQTVTATTITFKISGPQNTGGRKLIYAARNSTVGSNWTEDGPSILEEVRPGEVLGAALLRKMRTAEDATIEEDPANLVFY